MAKTGNGLFQSSVEVSFFVVNLVDDKNGRCVKSFDVFPEQFCAYFNPTFGVVDQYGCCCDPEGRNDFTDKVIQTRCVDEVDFGIFPGDVFKRGEE